MGQEINDFAILVIKLKDLEDLRKKCNYKEFLFLKNTSFLSVNNTKGLDNLGNYLFSAQNESAAL